MADDNFHLTDLLTLEELHLLSSSGKTFIQQVGLEVIRGVVLDILTGKNIRTSTETLTRRRIAALNVALLNLFMRGSSQFDNFIEQLPQLAHDVLISKNKRKEERWLAQWILGLTDKGVQNILRDDRQLLAEYRDNYIQTCREIILQAKATEGELSGRLQLGAATQANLNWIFMLYLLTTIGAQTLTIRGSDKSTYGKLFEKLVLGALLSILGFEYKAPAELENPHRVFWLSSRDDKRESDATLLYEAGKAARFDIGFIGKGNTEISLDKVSRFGHEIRLGTEKWYAATIIIVDRIGERSRIEDQAHAIGGTIVQMSASYWVQKVVRILHQKLGFEHPLLNMEQNQVDDFLKTRLQAIQLEPFIKLVAED